MALVLLGILVTLKTLAKPKLTADSFPRFSSVRISDFPRGKKKILRTYHLILPKFRLILPKFRLILPKFHFLPTRIFSIFHVRIFDFSRGE